jgi:hypothetical protein
MRRFFHPLLVATVICGSALGADPSANPAQRHPIPAATFSQFACSGFLSDTALPNSIQVFNGADEELYEPSTDYTTGDYVYLRRTDGKAFRVGQAYRLERPEIGFDLNPKWVPGELQSDVLPLTARYNYQRLSIKKLGRPYDDTGLIRVVQATSAGAIAKVVFTCDGVSAGDIAIPYVPHPIPTYLPGIKWSQFALPNGKLQGTIVAGAGALTYLGRGDIAYLNVGLNSGVQPGQRFSVFVLSRYNLPKDLQGLTAEGQVPRETIGELVVLRVESKSSVAIVIDSLREIAVGDGVQLE